jgi:Asp-tRNA(Asn)/Glu-tRNA(Gln) amidotransferase A subunit family amidase
LYTDRDPGYEPDAEEDPLNAVVRYCEVRGANSGPLAGYDVGLKDNVALAGTEMTCGSKMFEDVLAMPTTPQTAHEHREDLSRLEIIDRALNMLPNTAPFDVTGHPALSVPCGTSDGLPVGLMLVGERFDDATVLRAGHAFEQSHDWQSF